MEWTVTSMCFFQIRVSGKEVAVPTYIFVLSSKILTGIYQSFPTVWTDRVIWSADN